MQITKSKALKLVAFSFVGVLAAIMVDGLLPRKVMAVDPAPVVKPPAGTLDRTDKSGFGKFVSFQNGALTVHRLDGKFLVWNQFPAQTKFVQFDAAAERFRPVESIEAFKNVKVGTWIQVADSTVRIGEEDRRITGSILSFKDQRLLLMGKDPESSYLKVYGPTVHFSKFREDIPAYRSIDGGEYQLIGTANQALADAKEGEIVTLHDEGEGNWTYIEIGVKKK